MSNTAGDIVAQAGIDVKDFEAGIDRIVAKSNTLEGAAKRTDKALKEVGASSSRAGRGMQNFGFQVQDIAVQLEGGTNAMRVFAQQVPQLLGGFGGATGAIAGAVVAVGAGIASWVMGAKEASAEVAAFEKRIDDANVSAHKLSQSIRDIKEDTRLMIFERYDGAEGAKSEKQKLDFQKAEAEAAKEGADAIQKRQQSEAKLAQELAKRKRFEETIGKEVNEQSDEEIALRKDINAQTALADQALEKQMALRKQYQALLDLEKSKADKKTEEDRQKEKDDIAASEARIKDLKDTLAQETLAEKSARLEQEADAIKAKKEGSGGGLAYSKLEEEEMKLRVEKQKTDNEIRHQDERDTRSYLKDLTADWKDFYKGVFKLAEDAIKDGEKLRKQEEQIAKQQAQRLAKIKQDANRQAKDDYESAVDERLKSPQQRAADRREARKRARAGRSVNERERIRDENKARGAYGQHTQGDAAKAETEKQRGIFVSRNAPKIEAAMITAATLQVFQIVPK